MKGEGDFGSWDMGSAGYAVTNDRSGGEAELPMRNEDKLQKENRNSISLMRIHCC